ncbi:hypothetical protein FYJ85_17370 [Victivallaceae bacterium BBE-744-WT-12]|uniref:Glycosyl hydrolase family 32 N-terminal domain-containing protein n=1 Tax=Victivallis lenta TaxID=2606640 RepID=A0A844G972_9BACT|nr:hypothetical protein [Victivallis lenta]MST98809.1 hypothetical protein [Victivallis lenta]
MFQIPGHDVGDGWIYVDEAADTVHLFCLFSPKNRNKRWSIGHASSRDLKNWEFYGAVLSPGNAGEWDDCRLATGSVLHHDGRYFMAYTGHSLANVPPCGRIGMAVSEDLFRWEKCRDFPLLELDSSRFESVITGSRPSLHWRDPFLLEEEGRFHLFLCARSKTGDVKTRGTVAHFTSGDLYNWSPGKEVRHDLFAEELEVPQIYRIGGRYRLLFCTHENLLKEPQAGGNFVMTSDSLLGPYSNARRLEPCGPGYWYAAQFFCFRNQWYQFATSNLPDQTLVADPCPFSLD